MIKREISQADYDALVKKNPSVLYSIKTDKQKLMDWLYYCNDAATFEDIVHSYMQTYGCDFSARRICNFMERLNRSSIDKIAEMERGIDVARERATYLKCYLEGKMYASEEVARECVGLQIENAKAILDSVERVAL